MYGKLEYTVGDYSDLSFRSQSDPNLRAPIVFFSAAPHLDRFHRNVFTFCTTPGVQKHGTEKILLLLSSRTRNDRKKEMKKTLVTLAVLFIALTFVNAGINHRDDNNSDGDYHHHHSGHKNKCECISDKRKDEMKACSTGYWFSQVGPRSASFDQFVLNCMNENITSQPFAYPTDLVGKPAVRRGICR